MVVAIGDKAPNLKVQKWVQGEPTNIDKLKGKVILVEVFQVNCPGCFLYGLPEAIRIYNKYKNDGLVVLGLATAFEDFDKNTLENLELLLSKGIVIGETRKALEQYNLIEDGNKLPYKIPFPVAMDRLRQAEALTNDKILAFAKMHVPDFDSYSKHEKQIILAKVKQYLASRLYIPETFDEYGLNGTPSSIVIDREGIVRHVSFGYDGMLEGMVEALL